MLNRVNLHTIYRMVPFVSMIFQISILSLSFATAVVCFAVCFYRKHKHTYQEETGTIVIPPPLEPEDPYRFPSTIEQSTHQVSRLPFGGKIKDYWVSRIDWIGLSVLCSVFMFFCFGNLLAAGEVKVDNVTADGVIANIAIFVFLLVVTVLFVRWRIRPFEWLGLNWKSWYWVFLSPVIVVFVWVFLGIMQATGFIEWMEKMSGGSSTQDAVKMLRENRDNVVVSLMAFTAAVVAPVVEEVIFRGYIYTVAKKWIGMNPAIFFTSLVFAAGHGNATLLLPLLVLGILLALAYEATGSIWMPIAIHACFNGATVTIQLMLRAGLFTIPDQL